MELWANSKRRILRLTCATFIIAGLLGIDAHLSLAMGPKECAKLQIQISGIRKHLKGARDDYMELHFALARARGDDELYKSLRSHIMNLGDEIWKEKKSLDAKEDLWDRECRE